MTEGPDYAPKIIAYLDRHPEYDPGWAAYKAEQGDYWAERAKNPAGLLNAYGGYWDRERGRSPGAVHAGSVQKFYDDTYALAVNEPAPRLIEPGGSMGMDPTSGGAPETGGPYRPPTGGGTVTTPFTPPAARPSAIVSTKGGWAEWLKNLAGYQAPPEDQMASEYGENQNKAYIMDLINKTGARGMLSGVMLARLLRNADQAARAFNVNAGSQGVTEPTGYGEFLKSWVGGSPTGIGGPGGMAGYRAQVQQLIDRLKGPNAAAGPGGSSLRDIWLGGENNRIGDLVDAMASGVQGPWAGLLKNRMFDTANYGARMPGFDQENPGMQDWFDYLQQQMPGVGGFQGPSRGW